jgi:hypothetical protein
MSKTGLGRVLDRDGRDASTGPRARMCITVPSSWAEEGATLRVPVPQRLACARCDGGGCDGCRRSGGYRLSDRHAAELTLELPAGSGSGVALRLEDPFAGRGPVEQLIVEIRVGARTSDGVLRIPTPVSRQQRRAPPWITMMLFFTLVVTLAYLFSRL